MNEEMFDLLVQSVKEGGEILKGKREPASIYQISSIDVKTLRQELDLTES
ncbi:MAG: hypothetical protein U0Z75_06405 [Deinococcaceae bacterium]